MTEEPILDEIRRVRHELSERLDHDPRRVLEYYEKLQQRDGGRIVPAVPESDRDNDFPPPTPSPSTAP